ncbi:hypothetical protein GIB67_037919 [Kingdonia uniflora]|uniref:DUF4216 domain-containing protein n=1 Tax=Kingdonia uniflora TaxID=39325 RepID=A0A7J7LH02_9MAGN|nr:hypothetical protein GIB67_037919 [Kingdonia uniflora]
MNNGAKRNYTQGLRMFGDYDDGCAKSLDKTGKEYFLNTVEYEQARKWILRQGAKNYEWEQKYNTYKENLNSRSQIRRGNRRTEKPIDYVSWLRQQLKNIEDSCFKKLVDGPSFKAISYKSYKVNGYVFCTSESEKHKTTKNSGVSMRAITSFISRVESRCLVDAVTNLRYVNLVKLQRNLKDDDETFILASQAIQVFYCKDHSRPDEQWNVVLDSPNRLSKDVDVYEDSLVFAGRINVDDSILSLKLRLRANDYDAYETNEKRKSKRPKRVKKEDWIEFVDHLSTPEEQAKREKGNAAGSKIHSPHTTGRLGASGKKEILDKGRPKGSMMRYEIFMACHTKEDRTYLKEMKERMERMNRAIQKDLILMDKDLDNDAVAIEYGADGNGHVRGCNGHLNKTNLRVSAPFTRAIERERVKQAMLNEVQESLEV